ncbi:hypothetical protein Vadar_021566 [Vaccinium darrowii]|uniref:Uncharacterized protein n=1 Tax=Vaccinium darrowii TaxID=229202 RepID=A0ACB7XSI5_9ERIC|nr:hypothetical protein Vadar_021566 [Vaccinium darrowii]
MIVKATKGYPVTLQPLWNIGLAVSSPITHVRDVGALGHTSTTEALASKIPPDPTVVIAPDDRELIRHLRKRVCGQRVTRLQHDPGRVICCHGPGLAVIAHSSNVVSDPDLGLRDRSDLDVPTAYEGFWRVKRSVAVDVELRVDGAARPEPYAKRVRDG